RVAERRMLRDVVDALPVNVDLAPVAQRLQKLLAGLRPVMPDGADRLLRHGRASLSPHTTPLLSTCVPYMRSRPKAGKIRSTFAALPPGSRGDAVEHGRDRGGPAPRRHDVRPGHARNLPQPL